MARNQRKIGTELVTFTDGETKQVDFHAVSSYVMSRLRKQYRTVKFDTKGKITDSDFDDTEYTVAVLKQGVGSQLTNEDLQEIEGENTLKELYDKYYAKVTEEKKAKSTDTTPPKKESQ